MLEAILVALGHPRTLFLEGIEDFQSQFESFRLDSFVVWFLHLNDLGFTQFKTDSDLKLIVN